MNDPERHSFRWGQSVRKCKPEASNARKVTRSLVSCSSDGLASRAQVRGGGPALSWGWMRDRPVPVWCLRASVC